MNNNAKLCILCCHNFHRELAAAVSAEGWDDVNIALFPTRCDCLPISWAELSPLVGDDCTQVVILGMACLRTLGNPPASWPPVRLLYLEQCFHLVAGDALLSEAIERGTYLMTPTWLEHWPERLADMGFRPETAGEFFQDVARELLLLDTGIDPKASANLTEFATAVALPASRIAVGIDHTRLYLSKIVMEWRLEQSQHAVRKLNNRHTRELSDQMMAIDCLSRLGRIMTEAQAIAAIEELFRMLFAPEQLHYLRIEDGKIDPKHTVPPALLAQMLELSSDYAWTSSQQGFLLRIRRNGLLLGLVAIEQLAFPEYREHYLNLALAIADVCGLAIENARAYQRTKAVEQELQEKEERLSLATLVNGVGIWDWNLETQDMIWDDSMYALYHIRREDFSGTEDAWRTALHPDDLARGDREVEAALSGEKPFDTEFRVCWPNAEVHYIKAVANVFRDDSGKPLRMLGTNIDITEHKRIEDALRKASLYTRSLIEASLDPLITISPEGKITDVNQATENVTGRTRDELIGSDFCAYFTEPENARAAYRKVFSEGSVIDYPLSIRHVSGLITDVIYNASGYRNEQGEVEGVFAAARDITERKRVEAELDQYRHHLEELVKQRTLALSIAKDAAEAANRAKSIFLANMSHELRTPMNAILGFAQLMARDQRIPEEVLRNIATINRSGQHLLSLINDVLEISRIESGRNQVIQESFNLVKSLEVVREMIVVRANDKKLAFNVEYGNDLPRYVLGDAHRLQQVLINLLGNAVKFTEQGEIRLLVGIQPDQRILFSVLDTGPGISKEEQEHIFDAFYQVHGSVSKGEGSGLGLAISREFVRLMGGELTLKSKLNDGCTFSFSLPLPITDNRPSETKSLWVTGLTPGQSAPRILVAEDQVDNQGLIEQLLQQIGSEVCIASNGLEAVELFQSWRPQLILMDIRMPVMDGYEATRCIRKLPGGDTLPIIALTASVFEEDKVQLLDAGCNEMITKPIQAELLFDVIGRLLGLTFDYTHQDVLETRQEATQVKTGLTLATLPEALREELAKSAAVLDVEATQTIADQIRENYPEEAKLIVGLIENYSFEKLIDLCK
ncbi:MAG: response regulator [Methylobacter sp.]|nr:MAG: response regulator [Methylobacter sp.]